MEHLAAEALEQTDLRRRDGCDAFEQHDAVACEVSGVGEGGRSYLAGG
jgi:hypothetical protein